jgi:hypothetical protein
MRNSFEQLLASRLLEIETPSTLVPRILQSAIGQREGKESRRLVVSPFRRIATALVSAALSLVVLLGAFGQAGPTSRYSLADVTVVNAQIHLPTFARLSQADAVSRAVRWLYDEHPEVTGYQLISAYHEDALTQVMDPGGYVAYKSSLPENDFVLWFMAPPQGGYQKVTALVIVNALTGKIEAAQIRENK